MEKTKLINVRNYAAYLVVTFLIAVTSLVLNASSTADLKLNPDLNYSSDSNDCQIITGKNMKDGTINKGEPAYIIFYHIECYNSKRQARSTVELYEKYNGKVDFIIIDLDSPRSKDQSKLVKEHYKNYIPHVTVFNKEGKSVYDRSGEVRNSQMTRLIDGLVGNLTACRHCIHQLRQPSPYRYRDSWSFRRACCNSCTPRG